MTESVSDAPSCTGLVAWFALTHCRDVTVLELPVREDNTVTQKEWRRQRHPRRNSITTPKEEGCTTHKVRAGENGHLSPRRLSSTLL